MQKTNFDEVVYVRTYWAIKGNKLFAKWKPYEISFKRWIDKKDTVPQNAFLFQDHMAIVKTKQMMNCIGLIRRQNLI